MKGGASLLLLVLLAFPAGAQLEVRGVTVLTPAEVESLVARHTGDEAVTAEGAIALINALNAVYRERGFVTSGARPVQDAGGRLAVEVVEGQIPEVRLAGGSFAPGNFESRIQGQLTAPLNVADLQAAFNSLETEPAIAAVRGRVQPASAGQARVDVELVGNDAFTFELKANNHRSPSVGEAQAELALSHTNLTGRADQLHIALGHTEGLTGGSIRYRSPKFGAWRAAASLTRGDALVVESPFDAINIQSETDTQAISLERVFDETPVHTLAMSFGFETRRAETTLLGRPFDFTSGSVAGRSRAGVFSARVDFARRGPGRAVSLAAVARQSSSLGGGLVPDSHFLLWRAQLGVVQSVRLGERTAFLKVHGTSQFTSDNLPPFERFGLGGPHSVRGFRVNQILRDSAWELRGQLEMPVGSFTVYPFLDGGRAWNSESAFNVERAVRLGAAGLGVRFERGGFSVTVEAGARLSEKRRTGDELQDHGVHAGVSYAF